MRGGRAPSGQPARNLDGFPRQVSARPRQVSVRQGPVSRTMTDDAELGLDAVAPTVFGATQASIRPTNHGGAISQAKKGGISRDRKATMFNQPDAGSLAPPAQPAGRPVSRVMNLEGFGGGGETEDASAEGQTAEQWKRAESLRHDHAAARKDSQHFVTENADFITVDGKMVLKHGLKHADFAKRDSMVQRAESGDPEAIKELEVAAQKERERRASSEALQGNF